MDTTSRARLPANQRRLDEAVTLLKEKVIALLEAGEFATAKIELELKLADGVIQTVQGAAYRRIT